MSSSYTYPPTYPPTSFYLLSSMMTSGTILWGSVAQVGPVFSGFMDIVTPSFLPQAEDAADLSGKCRNFKDGIQTFVELETSRNNSLKRNLWPVVCMRPGKCKGCVRANDHSKVCYNYQEGKADEKEEEDDEDNVRINGMVDTLK
jgi:hypothetical protein